jgi:hypothetical protein
MTFSTLYKTASLKITNIFSGARAEWTVLVTLSVGMDPTLTSFPFKSYPPPLKSADFGGGGLAGSSEVTLTAGRIS